jgi:7-carboxy-7-deazaguanine synthase
LVVVTGGEPLLQSEKTLALLSKMVNEGYEVLLETNGSFSIAGIPSGVKVIMDIKTPSSGEEESFNLDNIKLLTKESEIKFVIAGRNDFNWSLEFLERHFKDKQIKEVLFSPAEGKTSFKEVARWVKNCYPSGRVQANIHKVYNIK